MGAGVKAGTGCGCWAINVEGNVGAVDAVSSALEVGAEVFLGRMRGEGLTGLAPCIHDGWRPPKKEFAVELDEATSKSRGAPALARRGSIVGAMMWKTAQVLSKSVS